MKIINNVWKWWKRNCLTVIALEFYFLGTFINLITADNLLQVILLLISPFFIMIGVFFQVLHHKVK